MEQQIAQACTTLETLRREAKLYRELHSEPRPSLRRQLARALRTLAASLEPELKPVKA
jgi:hypothetical protein